MPASSDSSTFHNTLSASANVEVVQNWLFVDANASISQQFISPFGTQSSDPSLNNSNRTEVSTVSVAPYVKGQIAGQVNYIGRAFYTYTNSGSSQASDSSVWGGAAGLRFHHALVQAELGPGLHLPRGQLQRRHAASSTS